MGFFLVLVLFLVMRKRLDSDPEINNLGRTLSILSAVGVTIDEWVATHAKVPSTEEGIAVLGLRERNPKDAWGRTFRYRQTGGPSPRDFILYSVGADGIDSNGSGDDVVYRHKPD